MQIGLNCCVVPDLGSNHCYSMLLGPQLLGKYVQLLNALNMIILYRVKQGGLSKFVPETYLIQVFSELLEMTSFRLQHQLRHTAMW